jgi:hypothetical protein
MKITISPSEDLAPEAVQSWTVSIDTHTNDDSTPDLVTALLKLAVATGHDARNVASAAECWAVETRSVR